MSSEDELISAVPTPIDEHNFYTYFENRLALYKYNTIIDVLPNIGSEFIVEIRAATQEDYPFTAPFRDQAILVQTLFSQKGCDLIRCNGSYPRGKVCTHKNEPYLFKSGNSTLLACEPACYNIVPDGNIENAQSVPTAYYEPYDACVIESATYKSLMIDDYNRSNTHPSINVDTIGTGFDSFNEFIRDDNGDLIRKYEINKFYCDAFEQQFNVSKKECETTTWQDIGKWTFGEYIATLISYGIDYCKTGLGPGDIRQPNVGLVNPSEYPNYLTNLKEWKSSRGIAEKIEVNIKLSDLGIVSQTRHMTWTNRYSAKGNLVEPLLVYTVISEDGFFIDNQYNNGTKNTYGIRREDFTKRINYIRSKERCPRNLMINDTGFRVREKKRWLDSSIFEESGDQIHLNWLDKLFKGILNTDLKQFKEILLMWGGDKAIKYSKTLLIKLAKDILPNLIVRMQQVLTRGIFVKTLSKTIVTHVLSSSILKLSIKIGIALTNLAIAAVDVVNYIFVVSMIADLAFSLWDPLKLHGMYTKEAIKNMSLVGYEQNVKLFGQQTPEMTLDVVFAVIELSKQKKNTDKKKTTKDDDDGNDKKGNDDSGNKNNADDKDDDDNTNQSTTTPKSNIASLNNNLKNEIFESVDSNGKTIKPIPIDSKQAPGSFEEQITSDQCEMMYVMSAEYFSAFTHNSEGSRFRWHHKEHTEPVSLARLEAYANSLISDEYINSILFSSSLTERFEQAKAMRVYISGALATSICAICFNSKLLVTLAVTALIILIGYHNYFVLYEEKITAGLLLNDILQKELKKILTQSVV